METKTFTNVGDGGDESLVGNCTKCGCNGGLIHEHVCPDNNREQETKCFKCGSENLRVIRIMDFSYHKCDDCKNQQKIYAIYK